MNSFHADGQRDYIARLKQDREIEIDDIKYNPDISYLKKDELIIKVQHKFEQMLMEASQSNFIISSGK